MTDHTATPSRISIVEECLDIMEDFLSSRQIVDLTGICPQHVAASLCSLQNYKVVDAVLVHGELFWFLTGEDTRQFKRNLTLKGIPRNDTHGRKEKGKRRKLFIQSNPLVPIKELHTRGGDVR